MVAVDLDSKSTKQLLTIVTNCGRLNRTSDSICIAAQKILDARQTGDYDMEKTIRTIMDHGYNRTFVNYQDIADASGLEWSKVRRGINRHLDKVCEYTEGKGWPLITAIVVHKVCLDSGAMKAANPRGFVDAARNAGRSIDIDEVAVVRREA